jgi:hypothetical protein
MMAPLGGRQFHRKDYIPNTAALAGPTVSPRKSVEPQAKKVRAGITLPETILDFSCCYADVVCEEKRRLLLELDHAITVLQQAAPEVNSTLEWRVEQARSALESHVREHCC